MTSLQEEKKRRFLINVAVAVVVAALVWFALKYLLVWLLPFIFGYLIAAIVQPTVYIMHKKLHIKRQFAAIFCTVLFVLLLAGLITFGVSRILLELSSVLSMIPSLLRQLGSSLDGIHGRLTVLIKTLPNGLDVQMNSWLDSLSLQLSKFASSLTSSATTAAFHTALKVPAVLIGLIVMVVAACFISSDYPKIRGFFMRQLPEKYQLLAMDLKNFFFVTIARLIRAYLTLMLITFLQLVIWITLLRVPHSIMIALLISIVDLLPVLGTGTVVIPWALVELAVGDPTRGVLLLVMYACITVLRNILEPRIVGHHIGLYPLVTLLSMYLGLQMFGGVGLLAFPLTVIIIKHLHDEGKIRLWRD